MAINPIRKSGVESQQSDALRAQPSAGEAGRSRDKGAEAAPRSDSVELSSQAQELSTADRAQSASGLSAERMREVLARLSAGYYDTPHVRDVVARRVLKDPDLYAE